MTQWDNHYPLYHVAKAKCKWPIILHFNHKARQNRIKWIQICIPYIMPRRIWVKAIFITIRVQTCLNKYLNLERVSTVVILRNLKLLCMQVVWLKLKKKLKLIIIVGKEQMLVNRISILESIRQEDYWRESISRLKNCLIKS